MATNRLWIIGTVLLIVLMLLGTYFLGVAPQFATIAANGTATTQVQGQNQVNEQILADLKEKFAHIDELRADLETMQESVPPALAQSPFIDEIGDIALENGVLVQKITFADPAVYTPTDNPDPEVQAAAAGLTSGNFLVIPVDIVVEGAALAPLNFLRGLQHSKRLILVHEVTWEGTDDDPATDGTRITLKGQIFVLTSAALGAEEAPVVAAPAS